GNVGFSAPLHGFESHKIRTDGAVLRGGEDNRFVGNTAHHDGAGYAFYTRGLAGVEVTCDNVVVGSGRVSDIPCTPDGLEPSPTPSETPVPTTSPSPSP